MTGNAESVAFLCAASDRIGFGHLSRSLNLADALRERGKESRFLVRPGTDLARRLVDSRGYFPELVERFPDVRSELGLGSLGGLDWVVADDYDMSSRDLGAISDVARLLVIDDLGDRDLSPASIVLNHTADSQGGGSDVSPNAIVLGGPRYALVGSDFSRRRSRSIETRRYGDVISRVAVSVGATDVAGWFQDITVALGAFHGAELRLAGLNTGSISGPGVHHMGHLSEMEMADLMDWSDLFVASASTLTWEVATLGVPTVFVVVAENQEPNGKHLRELGLPVAFSQAELPMLLEPLALTAKERRRISDVLTRLCDGQGAGRVADVMVGLA